MTNEAQKKWIEERILRDLESKFARLTGCGKLRLEPTVLPEEEQEKMFRSASKVTEAKRSDIISITCGTFNVHDKHMRGWNEEKNNS